MNGRKQEVRAGKVVILSSIFPCFSHHAEHLEELREVEQSKVPVNVD